MPQAIIRLFSSSKAWVVALAVVGIVLLAALGRVSEMQAIEQIKWLVIALLGAQGIEDAAHKFGLPPPRDPS